MHQRLFEMTLILMREGHTTAAALASRFSVSSRTIYRDVDALSAAGIPVYTEKGQGGGIFLLNDFVLDKTLLTKQEQEQLVAQFSSLAALGTPGADALLQKLGALFGQSGEWLQVDFAPWGGGDAVRQLFQLLQSAILQRHLVRFAYFGAAGAPAVRTVEPYRVVFRGQGWYLLAYCTQKCDFRFFKLNRMRDAEAAGGSFSPRALPPPTPPPAQKTVRVQLRLAPTLAHRALDEFAPEDLVAQPDGGFLASCNFPGGPWLLGWVLSFGPGAEVLQPAFLRRRVAAALRGMLRSYGG